MWTVLIALLEDTLKIVNQWLIWQTAQTQLTTRKLAYDIDESEKAKGRLLQAQIASAVTPAQLVAARQLLDDAAYEAGWSLNILAGLPDAPSQSPSPDAAGSVQPSGSGDLRPGLGVPAPPAAVGSSPDDLKPAGSAVPAQVTPIPQAPFSATGNASVFGRGYKGEDDSGDLEPDGKDSTGFFFDPATGKNFETHNAVLIGASLPREILLSTLLGVEDWRTQPVRDVFAKHGHLIQKAITDAKLVVTVHDFKTSMTADSIPLVDVGPSAEVNKLLDRTLGLCNLMNSHDDSHVAVWIHGPDKKPLALKGWLFDAQKVG